MKYLIVYIFIIIINQTLINSYLKIQFKSVPLNKIQKERLSNNYIHINISMGFPPQNPKYVVIKQEKYNFYLKNESYPYENSQTSKILFNGDFEIKDSICRKGLYLMDNIYLDENKYNISFILCTKSFNDEYSFFDGEIGFNVGYEDKYDSNFIRQLKANNIINNYIYSFIYENDDSGYILIGEKPHNINLNYNLYDKYSSFKEENLNWIHAVKSGGSKKWCITFDKISYSHSELYQIQRECVISIENRFIISTSQYFNLFKDIYGKKCKSYQYDFNYEFLSCDKDINKEFTPEIKFFSKKLNMNFTLDYNDLFFDNGDSYYFLVGTYGYNDEGLWILGKPFLKKYLLLYDMDTKMIGFYNKIISPIDNIETNNKSRSSFNTSIFINVILGIIIISLIFILYHFYIKKRRIRANELEDNFNYIAKDDKDIKEN